MTGPILTRAEGFGWIRHIEERLCPVCHSDAPILRQSEVTMCPLCLAVLREIVSLQETPQPERGYRVREIRQQRIAEEMSNGKSDARNGDEQSNEAIPDSDG